MDNQPARERRRRERWRALQAAAIRLIGERGFADVTVDDIAEAAGVSRRTFFNHFPTKSAALFDPDPADAERLAALLVEADGTSDPWAALRWVCVTFMAGHEDVVTVRRRLIGESAELDQYHRAAQRHVQIAFSNWMHRQLPDDPFAATLTAEAAGAILISAFTAWPPDGDPAALPPLVDRGFTLLDGGMNGVGHPAGSVQSA